MTFGPDSLRIDAAAETERITARLRSYLTRTKRKGVVVALSGGIDSSVVAALSVAALGPDQVFGLHLPERESSSQTLEFSQLVASSLGIDSVVEDLTEILTAAGCYRHRDDAIRLVCPEYGPGYTSKIVLPSVIDSDTFRLYSVVVRDPDGVQTRHRLSTPAYLGIVAATNFKQRARKMMEYYHADRLNYAVIGTPNRLEYDQGFFVKGGDGLADVKPIAHLYKTQVYAMAKHLGLPDRITSSTPTTDTYSLPQGQDEFYFALPYDRMDLMLYAYTHGVSAADAGKPLELSEDQVNWIYRDIETKRRTTRYLHLGAQFVEEVDGVGSKYVDGTSVE